MDNNEKDEFFDLPPAPAPVREAETAPQLSSSGGKKAARIAAVVLGMILVAVAGFLGGWYGQYYSLDEEVRTYLWAKSVLEKNYYQPIDEAELYSRLYDSLSIDPYTKFYSSQAYADYVAEGAGDLEGVGLSFFIGQKQDETARIFVSEENSPACKAGLRKGMYIVGFGRTEDSLVGGNYREFAEFYARQKDSFVLRCGYAPDGSDARNYTVQRESYQASYLYYRDSESSFRFRGSGKNLALTETNEPLAGLDEKTAYVRLNEFSGNNTPTEIVQILSKMKERGRENLILDLRSNGGGYLGILGDVASHLMRNAEGSNPVIASTVSRSGHVTRYICAQNDFKKYFNETSKVYVLADEYTASASECLLGVLIDYGTCSYGDVYLRKDENGVAKTFGKGIMQSHFTDNNGAAMKVTTDTVNWPLSGKCIHGVGVTEQDGAVGVPAPFIWGEEDEMLDYVVSKVCG